VSRQIRLLRAHGLIQKVPHENRYHLTTFGRVAVTAVLAARGATISDLNQKAAQSKVPETSGTGKCIEPCDPDQPASSTGKLRSSSGRSHIATKPYGL